MTTPKTGALTFDDFQAIWRSIVDREYREPLERAGDGHGIEVFAQAWHVFERISRAIDITTQAMFILPWSGQTNPSAAGEAKATVTLTFARTLLQRAPLRLAAGTIFAAHQIVDWGENIGEEVLTGLLYVLTDDLVFQPGDSGPFTIPAEAEKAGYSYNDPQPNTIVVIPQVGYNFENDLADVLFVTPVGLVAPQVCGVFIRAANQADMFVSEHVGQQLLLTVGANAGNIARIKTFYPPDVPNGLGSMVELEFTQSVQGSAFAGTFQVGEEISFTNGGPEVLRGRLLGFRTVGGVKNLTFVVLRGNPASVIATTLVTGVVSAATLTVASLIFPQTWVGETGTAAWRILQWEADWNLTVTNVLAPDGGLAGWLDELGAERAIDRATKESDVLYRQRIAVPADVVTPNAIKRSLNRSLGTIPWCFREVGTSKLPGFFLDQDALDTDTFTIAGVLTGTFLANERIVLEQFIPAGPLLFVVGGFFGGILGGVLSFIATQNKPPTVLTPPGSYRVRGLTSGAMFVCSASPVIGAGIVDNRFRYVLDYASFRAYFLVGLTNLSVGEFGFAFDAGPNNAWGAPIFFDGFPVGASAIYGRARQALNQVKAGGVGFDLYLIDEPCT